MLSKFRITFSVLCIIICLDTLSTQALGARMPVQRADVERMMQLRDRPHDMFNMDPHMPNDGLAYRIELDRKLRELEEKFDPRNAIGDPGLKREARLEATREEVEDLLEVIKQNYDYLFKPDFIRSHSAESEPSFYAPVVNGRRIDVEDAIDADFYDVHPADHTHVPHELNEARVRSFLRQIKRETGLLKTLRMYIKSLNDRNAPEKNDPDFREALERFVDDEIRNRLRPEALDGLSLRRIRAILPTIHESPLFSFVTDRFADIDGLLKEVSEDFDSELRLGVRLWVLDTIDRNQKEQLYLLSLADIISKHGHLYTRPGGIRHPHIREMFEKHVANNEANLGTISMLHFFKDRGGAKMLKSARGNADFWATFRKPGDYFKHLYLNSVAIYTKESQLEVPEYRKLVILGQAYASEIWKESLYDETRERAEQEIRKTLMLRPELAERIEEHYLKQATENQNTKGFFGRGGERASYRELVKIAISVKEPYLRARQKAQEEAEQAEREARKKAQAEADARRRAREAQEAAEAKGAEHAAQFAERQRQREAAEAAKSAYKAREKQKMEEALAPKRSKWAVGRLCQDLWYKVTYIPDTGE